MCVRLCLLKYCIIGHSFFQTKGMDTMNQLEVSRLTLDSREVAEMLPKRHDHLIRDIDIYNTYLVDPKIGVNEFWQESTYKDKIGRTLKCYQITKKGCEFLAHKMTGKKGAIFTATYINRFHEMEQQLQAPREEIQLERKTYKGIPVLTTSDMSVLLGIPHGTVLWYCQKYQVKFIMLTGQTLQDYKKENKNREKFVSKLAVFTKSTVIKMLRCVNRYTKDIQKIIEAYFVESLPASQGMIEKSKCISLKHKKNAIDELRKQAKTIDGMLKMLPECKRTTEKHNASIEFVIEGVMSLLLDLQDLRRNMI